MTDYPAMHEHPSLGLFAELLAVPSPSSREEALAAVIARQAAELRLSAGDRHRGQCARSAGRPESTVNGPLHLLRRAHGRDRHGRHQIGDDGTLTMDRSGGLYPWKLGEGPITILGDVEQITGVLCMGSTHAAVSDKAVTWADVRVLTGLSPAQLARAGVRPGVVAVPTRDGFGPVLFGDPADPLVVAWTFDDRMGCVALLRMLETLAHEGLRPQMDTSSASPSRRRPAARAPRCWPSASGPTSSSPLTAAPSRRARP